MKLALVCLFPDWGHVKPLVSIATEAARSGFDVHFFVTKKASRLVEGFPATLLNIDGGEEMTALFRLLSKKSIFFLNFSRFSHTNLLMYPPLIEQAAAEWPVLSDEMEAFAPDLIVCDSHLFGELYHRLGRFAPILFSDCSATLGGYRRPFDGVYGPSKLPVKSLVEFAGRAHGALFKAGFYLWHWRQFLRLREAKRLYHAALGPKAGPIAGELGVGLGWVEQEMLGERIGGKAFFPPVATNGDPIASELSDWLASRERVIYVSFGSVVALDRSALQGIAASLKDAGLPVIWSAREADELRSLVGDDPQFFVTPWVAQSTLLCDPRICLFVTQAGASSAQEALIAGTPMLCVPFHADQRYIASLVERLGVGVYAPKRKLRSLPIKQAIDPRYQERARELAARIVGAENGLADFLKAKLCDRPDMRRGAPSVVVEVERHEA